MKKFFNRWTLMGALLVGTALPLAAQQGQNPWQQGQMPNLPQGANQYMPWNTNQYGTNQYTGGGTNLTRRQQWQAFHEQMAAEIKQQDTELQQMVTQMNNAPEDQKADAVAAV